MKITNGHILLILFLVTLAMIITRFKQGIIDMLIYDTVFLLLSFVEYKFKNINK